MQSDIRLIEIKSEIGAGTRGASLGIDALKIAAHDFNSKFFQKIDTVEVKTENDWLYEQVKHPFAKHIDGISMVLERTCEAVNKALEEKKFPLVLAGDHSTAAGTIAGIKKANKNKRLGVIWIDAHADLHSPYTTPSGNMHGMPLAMALGEDNLELKTNDLSDAAIKEWGKIKNIGIKGPKLNYEDLVYVCVRDTEYQENHLISKHKIKNFTVADIRKRGVEKVAFEILACLEKCDIIYLSFDVDSLDPKISQGTGTPVPNGINEREAAKILQNLVQSPKVVCFEMVEINPTLDKENLMAENAFEILVKVRNQISKR